MIMIFYIIYMEKYIHKYIHILIMSFVKIEIIIIEIIIIEIMDDILHCQLFYFFYLCMKFLFLFNFLIIKRISISLEAKINAIYLLS